MSNQFEPITTETFIQRAHRTHSNEYNYSKVRYVNRNQKVLIICDTHGEFEQNPSNHLRGTGCPHCGKVKRVQSKSSTLTTEKFISRANEVHNNKYEYSKTKYITAWSKVTVSCPDHGEFQTNYLHLKGIGCPQCGIIKATQTKIRNGHAVSDQLRTNYELYEAKVNKITEYNYRHYKHLINPLGLRRARTNGWHLDHKFSKQQGFIEQIPPEIIGHWSNLEMLWATENRKKYMGCSTSKETLFENYKYIIMSELAAEDVTSSKS